MGNRNKVKKAASPQKQQFGLAGWTFLVVEGPKLLVRGQVLYSPSPDNHFIQFGAAPDPVFFRFMSNVSLQEGSLYPNAQEADKFLAAYMQQFEPAVPSPAEGGVDVDAELQERADVNGYTLEEQLQYDAEHAAYEAQASSPEGVEAPADEASGD